jgi:hypothetical protein
MRSSLLTFGVLLALTSGVAACGGSSGAAAAESAPRLPGDLAHDVEEAQTLGRAIFEQDLASSRASDAVVHAMGEEADARVEGWITRRTGDAWTVEFIGKADGVYAVFWDAQVKGFGTNVPARPVSPPRPLDPEGATMARARATAIGQPFRACSSRYNTVVLPASLIEEKGFLVYLLAATSKQGEWIVGGHQRFLISADGARVIQHRPLSKGCLSVPAAATERSSAWVTHIVSDAPAETHVFLSLSHQAPLYVGTRRGIWKVWGEKISFEGS